VIKMVEDKKTKEKECWVCRRKEKEIEDFEEYEEFLKDQWLPMHLYSGVLLCPICRHLIYEISLAKNESEDIDMRMLEFFEEEILPKLKISKHYKLEIEDEENE